ncbi:MAG: nucleotidyltransferase domain-containing protein [Candidatus Woesearchaeota archaeon]
MEFQFEPAPKQNKEKYSKEHIDIAYKFAEKAYKEFGSFIKTIALFGSAARKDNPEGDIDILIVVDDLSINLTGEVVETYRLIQQRLINDISSRLHVTTLKLTSFWEYLKAGDPIAINILRDGLSIIDTGFFEPVQALLRQGRIRPTPESVWSYFIRAPATLQNSRWHLLQATLDLYWAAIDAAHAALMRVGEIPPTPAHVADLIQDKLVKNKKTKQKYVTTMREIYNLAKKIMHREVKEIDGEEYMKHRKKVKEFVDEMRRIVEGKNK